MIAAPLFRDNLDARLKDCGQCGLPHPLSILPRCHPFQGMTAVYEDGLLTLRCEACFRVVGQFVLARLGN